MEEEIEFLEKRIELNKQMYLEFGKLLNLNDETVTAVQNLINKYKEQEKIIELMAENIYNTSDTLNMLNIGKEINYDLEKIFNGIEDKEAIKIIIEYFEKKAKGE